MFYLKVGRTVVEYRYYVPQLPVSSCGLDMLAKLQVGQEYSVSNSIYETKWNEKLSYELVKVTYNLIIYCIIIN